MRRDKMNDLFLFIFIIFIIIIIHDRYNYYKFKKLLYSEDPYINKKKEIKCRGCGLECCLECKTN